MIFLSPNWHSMIWDHWPMKNSRQYIYRAETSPRTDPYLRKFRKSRNVNFLPKSMQFGCDLRSGYDIRSVTHQTHRFEHFETFFETTFTRGSLTVHFFLIFWPAFSKAFCNIFKKMFLFLKTIIRAWADRIIKNHKNNMLFPTFSISPNSAKSSIATFFDTHVWIYLWNRQKCTVTKS